MSETTLSTNVRKVGNVAILDIEGEITASSEEALGEAYAEGADGGTKAVVLNFTGLEYRPTTTGRSSS
jgi:anti-anti-sigma regulatory factor